MMRIIKKQELPDMPYRDRQEAARKLVQTFENLVIENPLVIGHPRSGVILADAIATALNAPLDVIATRAIRTPGPDSWEVGAIGPNGVRVIDRLLCEERQIASEQLEQWIGAAMMDIDRRLSRYRLDRPMPDVAGKSVVLVTDGINDSLEIWAAIRAIKRLNPLRLILSTPIALTDVIPDLEEEVDTLVCPIQSEDYWELNSQYQLPKDVDDQDVMDVTKKYFMLSVR